MGTGGSFLRQNDEDDVLGTEYDSQGVVKRIPIEVKPRGRLGLRSVRSLGKPKGGSLRSALSVDLENPEVEKIRKDFEMYRLNKENEIANIQKKAQKLETENKRLRVELQALQKTRIKLREDRDGSLEAERQARVRAAAFESDRDKIQRQFKIFRETKESELQNLLKARRELEAKLSRGGHDIQQDANSKMEGAIGTGNPGDWWTALESEPSLGSTTQLHTPAYKGPEFANTMMEMEGPYMNVNKDDWNAAAASLANIFPTIPESLPSNTVRVYVSAPKDVHAELSLLIKEFLPVLKKLCSSEGRFINIVHMPCDSSDSDQEKHIQARCRQIDQATIFLAFLGGDFGRYAEADYNSGHLTNPGARPAIFCFKDIPNKKQTAELDELKQRVRDSGSVKVIEDYTSPKHGVDLAVNELERIINLDLGIEHKKESNPYENIWELDGPVALCGGSLWDIHLDYEQLEALAYAGKSSCELGFEKYYERLNSHVCMPGPLPPLLVGGLSGSGRSLLLAKWIELQQHKSSASLVLYHFVGSSTSCSADPIIMIRRLTAQLMQHVSTPPSLTCDPVRLVEEFPKWLEKVSSKMPGGVVLVLDSIDRLQNGESQLKWLLDPLPVDTRIIVSVHSETCPQAWRSWPSQYIEELSNKNVKELLRADLASLGKTITSNQESQILTHCRSPSTCNPLYVSLLASDIARCSSERDVRKRLDKVVKTHNAVELFKAMLDWIVSEYETSDTKGMLKKVLRLIYSARNGLSEAELFEILPELTWNFWAPLCDALTDRLLLTFRSGLLIFAHEQAREAANQRFLGDGDEKIVRTARQTLRGYFMKSTGPIELTYRVADELPWLNRQLADKSELQANILDLCIFVKLYGRGRCAELINYWQFVGVDKSTMAQAYFTATKKMEELVGHYNGLVTLPRIADVYEALGRFLRDLALHSEALTPLQRALEIRETALDPDHPSVAQSLHQLAGLNAQQSKFATAEALYKQSLEIYEGAFGRDHFLVAKELDALAVLYQKQGKHEQAEPLHKRAVSIRKKTRTPRVTSGQIRGVDPLRRRVLQLEELAMGPDSPDLARTLNEIGVLYYLQNNVETAEQFFNRSIEMREAVLGLDSPDLAQSLNNMAALYNDRKQYDRAQELYEKALEIRKRHFPEDHPSVASVVKHLGMLYKKMNNFEKAEPLYQEIVEVRERCFGANHPSVATALVNLAVLYSQQSKHAEALPLYERALKIYEDSFGPSHPRVSETLRNMALLKYELGEFETAARLYKRSTEIKENDPSYNGKMMPSRRSSTGESASTVRSTHIIQVQPQYIER